MDKKTARVAELIKIDDIVTWNKGDYILIEAQTGRGKTYFIRERLKELAKSNKSKILLLSPRSALKKQNELALVDDNDKIITLMNYQDLEQRVLNKDNIGHFDYVVADECHYIYDDSTFNKCTDITWKWLNDQVDSIRIFMSATIDLFKRVIDTADMEPNESKPKYYNLESNYNYIQKFYYYNSDEVIRRLFLEIPNNEKAIYFTSAKKAYETSRMLDNAAFYCSSQNKFYYKYIDKNIENEIFNEAKHISCKILCTTNVLDAGINIVDKSFKYVIVDKFDLNTIVQMVGRRRISSYSELNEDDKINVYFKNQNRYILNKYYNDIIDLKNQGDYFLEHGSIEYIKKYHKPMLEIIDIVTTGEGNCEKIEIELNEMRYIKYCRIVKDIKRYLSNKEEYLSDICEKFKIPVRNLLYLEEYYDKFTITDFFSSFMGIEIFEEKQQMIKELLLEKCYSIKNENNSRGLRTMKVGTVNKIMEDKNLPYVFESKRTRINGVQKRCWVISNKIDNNVTDFT